jgi:hypothetical protein
MHRFNPCEKVLNVKNVGNLGLKWSYTTGSGVESSPAVTNGVVYFGSDDVFWQGHIPSQKWRPTCKPWPNNYRLRRRRLNWEIHSLHQ